LLQRLQTFSEFLQVFSAHFDLFYFNVFALGKGVWQNYFQPKHTELGRLAGLPACLAEQVLQRKWNLSSMKSPAWGVYMQSCREQQRSSLGPVKKHG